MPHRPREAHDREHPVHMALRVLATLPDLREARLFRTICDAAARAATDRFVVVHCAVQRDLMQFLVEAPDRDALIRGARGLTIRVARAVNRAAGRRGKVFADRYHARTLGTPQEVENALAYVLAAGGKRAAVGKPATRLLLEAQRRLRPTGVLLGPPAPS